MKNNDIMSFAEFRERHGTEVAEYVHQRIKQQHGIDFYAEIEAMLDAEYNLYVEHFTEKTTGEN